MANISAHINEFKKHRLSTIVRTDSEENAYKAVKASVLGGIKFIEITLTIPNALQLIKKCRAEFLDVYIGAGTVLTLTEAQNCCEAGAQYLVSPVLDLEILKWANDHDILFIPGAVSPSEFYTLYKNNAQLIKYYPAISAPLNYIKLIKNPLPNLQILATGGINLDNIEQFLANGCLGCGVTEGLGNPGDDVAIEDLITLAQQYVNKIKISS